MSNDKPTIWLPSPGAAHSSMGNEIGYWEALAHNLEFRRNCVLPVEAERKRQREEIEQDKRAAAGKLKKGEIIGPPDPRAGRPRLK